VYSIVTARYYAEYGIDRPLANKSTANQRKEHNVEKYIHWVRTLLVTWVKSLGYSLWSTSVIDYQRHDVA